MRDGSAAATAGEAADRLAEAVKTGETTVGSVKPEQVKDAETLDVLSKLLKQAKAVRIPAADANQWLLWELRRGGTALGDAAGKADGLAKRAAASSSSRYTGGSRSYSSGNSSRGSGTSTGGGSSSSDSSGSSSLPPGWGDGHFVIGGGDPGPTGPCRPVCIGGECSTCP